MLYYTDCANAYDKVNFGVLIKKTVVRDTVVFDVILTCTITKSKKTGNAFFYQYQYIG